MSNLLQVRDNFVVNSKEGNIEDVDFYMLNCITIKQIVIESITNQWLNVIGAGRFFIDIFYAEVANNIGKLLNNSPIALMRSHLVRVIRIPSHEDPYLIWKLMFMNQYTIGCHGRHNTCIGVTLWYSYKHRT